MNNPIPLDLAQRVLAAYVAAPLDTTADEDMQAALAAHLPELAACHYREVDPEVILKALRSFVVDDHVDALAGHVAAALSDATNGGHWEECDYSAYYSDEAERGRRRGTTYENYSAVTYERWVPADPDAALLTIVDADTLARLREVAEVTAR